MSSEQSYRLDGYVPVEAGTPVPKLTATQMPDLPAAVDLSPMCSPVEDQGHIGSCTANSVAGALEYHQILHRQPLTDLSRLFLYYNARKIKGAINEDNGCSMPQAVASFLAFGACPETVWPYDPGIWNREPPETAYAQAIPFQGLGYAMVNYGVDLKIALAAGLPIIFGMQVPPRLLQHEAKENAYAPAPKDGKWEPPEGGHAMLIVGYDDSKNAWIIRNSWGSAWGRNGYAWIDYAVVDHYRLPDAFWTIGALDRAKYFNLAGPPLEESVEATVAAAPRTVQDQIHAFKANLRGDLESNLQNTRDSLRDRLRGPGAGGGYLRGPGAGGGYDRGPGVGGGYDRGPGAGGGYDRTKGPGGGNARGPGAGGRSDE